VELPPGFFASGREVARKWADWLTVTTSCAVVDARWLAAQKRPQTPQ
jgi:hypothetical protein